MSRGNRKRELKPAIAIVGEGKTEQIYFTQLRNYEKIGFTVKPELPKHSDVKSLVNKAIELITNKGFDLVFCVFDLDEVNTDANIRQEYKKLKRDNHGKQIIFIENNPSMEFWFLLHFIQTTREFDNYGQLERLLKKHIPDYEKTIKYFTAKNIYAHLKEHQTTANENAKHSIDHATPASSKSEVNLILKHLKIF